MFCVLHGWQRREFIVNVNHIMCVEPYGKDDDGPLAEVLLVNGYRYEVRGEALEILAGFIEAARQWKLDTGTGVTQMQTDQIVNAIFATRE